MPVTPTDIQARMLDLRRIAAPIVQHYLGDLDRDEEILRAYAHASTFVWLPYESGTHLVPLLPGGPNEYLAAVERNFAAAGDPYFVTREGVRRTDWASVQRAQAQVPTARYQVIDVLTGAVVEENPDLAIARMHACRRERPTLVREPDDVRDALTVDEWQGAEPTRAHYWAAAIAQATAVPPPSARA